MRWKERGLPIVAELALFGGRDIRAVLSGEPNLFKAVGRLADLSTSELARISTNDLGEVRMSLRGRPPHPGHDSNCHV